MPSARQPRHIRLAVIAVLGGLLAMGSMFMGSRRAAPVRATPTVAAIAPAMVTQGAGPAPSTTPSATASPTPSPTATASPTPSPTASPTPTTPPTATPTPAPVELPLAPDGQVRKARVPILMYHYVGGLPANPDIYRVDLTVTPDKFEAQLAYLQTAGYTGITLEDLVRHLAEGAPLPPKPIILTFDDGYIDNLLYAFPLLRQYGFPGTFFVITGFLDEGRPGYISWEQARLMQEGGMDIQSHSVSHEELRQKPAEYLVSEITGSQQAIEERLQKPARFFAYPFGRYDQQAIEVLRAAGYWAAVTTAAGVEHSSQALFELRRVRVHGAHPLDRFADTLEYYER